MSKTITFLISVLYSITLFSQEVLQDSLLDASLTNIYIETINRPGRVTVDSIAVNDNRKTIEFHTNLSLSFLPMREDLVLHIYDSVRHYLPPDKKSYIISVFSDGKELNHLIPNYYRSKHLDNNRIITHKTERPLVSPLSHPTEPFSGGLQNNHIAMWQSHGWYYEQKLGRWEWQRARIFQTVEDLYTQSYVVPFLVPMLENAGANVLMPRERDYNKTELIIDNDNAKEKSLSGNYNEINGSETWNNSAYQGFAHPKEFYIDGENPFKLGSARQIRTITRGNESFAEWTPYIPQKGRFGVYISYQTVDSSADDALYTVHHAGGQTEFKINQQMGGGTWIFLGYFDFEEGSNHKITLSNKSRRSGRTIIADAVKIGGGMGNIARLPHSSQINYVPETSGYPRYTEGARYWMQWAGVPDSIYNLNESKNDYIDDYASRGRWVNWLMEDLNIPLDMAFAFHTDAGTFWGDTIVGTLGIYMTNHNEEKFANGKSRWASRDLTEIIMDEIVTDIRREYEPKWTRRHLWNRSYAEARIPEVPTMLLELLSHQNFADMRYGLDPGFRFMVSRSIYKGMLKFIATQYNRPYVVQPLPVKNFSAVFNGETEVQLTWQPVEDQSEPSAAPKQYIVYRRINGKGFDNGVLVNSNNYKTNISKDEIHSFKVVAVNEGGISFPSETLSVYRKSNQKGEVLIVNGFTRTSAPFSFTTSEDSIAGFVGSVDNGVPYIADYHFIGQMNEFRRIIPWMDDDASGFGDSNANYETTKIAGNTFDYPYTHGLAFAEAGYSFVSSSAGAVESEIVNLADYETVNWILGKQRESVVARGAKPPKFKTFSKKEQQLITDYCNGNRNIIISGAFVGTDLWDNPYALEDDKKWAQNTLKYKWRNNNGAVTGKIKAVPSPFTSIKGNFNYFNALNSESYVVENPDAIEPANDDSFTIFRYSENNLSAGVLYKGVTYNSCILGFPIESIKEQNKINDLVKNIMQAFKE